ncbi:MAG: N-6 DNA methylase [Thermoproteales archaeon]|nr:N-6 DNA methylase [Thermoproteales archaeon]
MVRVTEDTLYDYICDIFREYGWVCNPNLSLKVGKPDITLTRDGYIVLSEVKIDSERKLLDAITDAREKAQKVNTSNIFAILFPEYVRRIHPDQLGKVFPNLEVKCLFLTDWYSDSVVLPFRDAVELFNKKYEKYLKKRMPEVDYNFVLEVVREAIRDLASILRNHITEKPLQDTALAVIGRFELFKLFVEELAKEKGEEIHKEIEEETKLLTADIAAYIFVNQILFYHIISEKLNYDSSRKLPELSPLSSLQESFQILDILNKLFEIERKRYEKIFGFNIIPILKDIRDQRIPQCIIKLINALKLLRPQHIEEDLFGRLYNETIPPETRKNLGAFYTKPEAAKLLANLAIDRWDVKILDPACGSGTLLVESYLRKKELAPLMDKHELHKKLLEQIYGIDIMHFAFHMASINLASQDLEEPVEPNIMVGDGISKMLSSNFNNTSKNLAYWFKLVSKGEIPTDFDLVIMNPPFTRRERFTKLLGEKERRLLERIEDVWGRVGYWAYFVVASDKVLKNNGIIALVAPEGFFNWEGECVRSFLLRKGYGIRYIFKSRVEFFSEQARFRDYIVVLEKGKEYDPMVVCLKKPLKDIDIKELTEKIRKFERALLDRYEDNDFLYIKRPKEMISEYLKNLKPLVAFNTIEGFETFSELIRMIKHLPTLEELGVSIFQYNPGYYSAKDDKIAKYARRLFASKYGARGPSLVFWVDSDRENEIIMRTKDDKKFKVRKDQVVLSLRSYAEVKHMDLTNEEEYAIIDPSAIPKEIRESVGLVNISELKKACNDIKEAYRDHAGNILLGRRVYINTLYHLAYYSKNKITGTAVMLNLQADIPEDLKKVLVLYLNSSFTLIQLLALLSETRGTWVDLHDKPIWSLVRVPDLNKLDSSIIKETLRIFNEISKQDVKPMYQRIKEKDSIQRKIDEISMKMLGIEYDLDKLYDVLTKEIEILIEIIQRTSRTSSKLTKKKEEKPKTRQRTLLEFEKS